MDGILIYKTMRTTENRNNMDAVTPWITEESEKPNVVINDVTLRDGKQALPWYNIPTKQDSADFIGRLADSGVHHAEIGFPAVPGDPETQCVEHVVNENKDRDIMMFALSRLVTSDIEMAIKTLSPAKYKGIHTFVGISKEHMASRPFNHEQVKRWFMKRLNRLWIQALLLSFLEKI